MHRIWLFRGVQQAISAEGGLSCVVFEEEQELSGRCKKDILAQATVYAKALWQEGSQWSKLAYVTGGNMCQDRKFWKKSKFTWSMTGRFLMHEPVKKCHMIQNAPDYREKQQSKTIIGQLKIAAST